MFPNPAKQYPNLTEYLLKQTQIERQESNSKIAEKIIPWLFVGPALSFLFIAQFAWIGILLGICGVAATLFVKKVLVKPRTPRQIRQEQSREVAQRLHQMSKRRRIHRDIDTTSLVVLDECAKQWNRAQVALADPIWKSDLVPAQYRSIHEQAVMAVDDSMDDVMLMYRDRIPSEVTNREAMDYVEEAIETFVLREPTVKQAPAVAWEAQKVAEKLQEIASEADRIVQEVSLYAASPHTQAKSLDLVLSELRTIRQAEEELHEDTTA